MNRFYLATIVFFFLQAVFFALSGIYFGIGSVVALSAVLLWLMGLWILRALGDRSRRRAMLIVHHSFFLFLCIAGVLIVFPQGKDVARDEAVHASGDGALHHHDRLQKHSRTETALERVPH